MTQLRQHASTEGRTDVADWDDGTGTVVTFNTITYQLWQEWKEQCVEKERRADSLTEDELRTSGGHIANHSEFQAGSITGPGIYHEYFDAQQPEFLIVVPKDSLTQRACEFWVKKLNAKYHRDFELDWEESADW